MTYRRAMFLAARRYWISLLRETDGNVARAARRAGFNRTACHRVLLTLSLDPAHFRDRRALLRTPRRARSDMTAWRRFVAIGAPMRMHVGDRAQRLA